MNYVLVNKYCLRTTVLLHVIVAVEEILFDNLSIKGKQKKLALIKGQVHARHGSKHFTFSEAIFKKSIRIL